MTEIENRNPDPLTKNIVLLTAVDDIINATRANSVWPLTFGLACCAIEMMATGAAKYDLDRFGSGPFRGTPRQSDLMVVAGTVTHKMAPRVKRLYDQMVKGVDLVIPVDVYIPGCPPRPEALLEGLFKVQKLMKREKILDRTRRTTKPEVYQPV